MDTNQGASIPETAKSWSFKERISKLWKEKGNIFSEIKPTLSDITPKLSRLNLTSNWSWLFAIAIQFLFLAHKLGPLVFSEALTVVIAPIGVAAGLFAGLVDFSGIYNVVKNATVDPSSGLDAVWKIIDSFSAEIGYAVTAISAFLILVFLQSIYRTSHFLDSLFHKRDIKSSVKELLAITNPLLTFSIFNYYKLTYLFGAKSLIVASLGLSLGPKISKVFVSKEVGKIVDALAATSSTTLILIILAHLAFVAFWYVLFYKIQCKLVDVIFEKDLKSFFKKVWTVFVNIWDAVWGWLVAGVLGSIVVSLVVSCAQNLGKPTDIDKYGFYRRSGSHDYCSVVTKNNEVFAFAHSKGILHIIMNPRDVHFNQNEGIPYFNEGIVKVDRIFETKRAVNYLGVDCREFVNSILVDDNFMQVMHQLARIEYSPVEYKMRGQFIDVNKK